ncbi:MAG: pyridoxamine 5'-phosphate oxidase [Sphingobacteriales bacterium]|nr:MAG: pyridoxamine 5'-phosphate oxidase [Sphingobacteriales bacterium]
MYSGKMSFRVVNIMYVEPGSGCTGLSDQAVLRLYENIRHHYHIGSLFIELDSRRRLRVNGTCTIWGSMIHITVQQAYPNCPKYIQRRVMNMPDYFETTQAVSTTGTALDKATLEWIRKADTFFIASAAMDDHVDVSHRGGNPGFITITEDGRLKIPDYPGNSLFNTLGNIIQNPRVGLLFIDFDNRRALQLTGMAELLFDQRSEMDLRLTMGTGRFWLFHPEQWIHTTEHHQVAWNLLDYSPFNP